MFGTLCQQLWLNRSLSRDLREDWTSLWKIGFTRYCSGVFEVGSGSGFFLLPLGSVLSSLVSVWSFILWVSSGPVVVLSSELFSGLGFLLLGFVVLVYSVLAIIESFALDLASLCRG